MSYETFETGDTKQFTWQSSIAPDAAPILKIVGIDGSTIASLTSIQSDSTHWYYPFTFPTSEGYYRYEWFAQKTVSASARNLIVRDVFRVTETNRP